MCGIAGLRLLEGGSTPDPSVLQAMANTLQHRGPDDSGTWAGDGIGLAHTRLSIIDLAASKQPMHSPDGRWHLAFNGEIYNYRELRQRLRWDFRTAGDTEVLLAGLALEGLSFLERLVGQFAFAAHDSLTCTTHLVRDRLGVLPLYWSEEPDRVGFASEVKALHPASTRRPTVDLRAVEAYLGRRSVPAPWTMFSGVRKVAPGHRIEIGRTGAVSVHRWWAPPAVERSERVGFAEAVTAVHHSVHEAVSAALVADVPVGAYLSGGLDSSLIVAVMSQLRRGQGVETFAAGFGDHRNDELPWAAKVSKHLGTTHHEVAVRAADFEELWPRLAWHRDAPVSEPADIAVFRLAEAAKRRVSVVLSGEGGDELFAGYPKYRAVPVMDQVFSVPSPVRSPLLRRVERSMPASLARARIAVRVAASGGVQDQAQSWFAPFTHYERAALLPGVQPYPVSVPGGADPVDAMLRADLQTWLPDNLLERGDRMSMAASLELRPPLLDHRLVELAFSLPSRVKVRKGVTKAVLKEVARKYLPDDVVDRKKVGFRVPLDAWFRSGLRDMAWDLLTGPSSFVAQNLDAAYVRRLLERHSAGRSNEEGRIWTLLSLEVWHDASINRGWVPAPGAVASDRSPAVAPGDGVHG